MMLLCVVVDGNRPSTVPRQVWQVGNQGEIATLKPLLLGRDPPGVTVCGVCGGGGGCGEAHQASVRPEDFNKMELGGAFHSR